MLKVVTGNLIDAAKNGEVNVIAHCCNCMCNMGAGIAPQIKRAFPYAYAADLDTSAGDQSKLGSFSLGVPEEVSGPLVYNLYGQYRYGYNGKGRQLDYDALYDALEAMAKDLHKWVNTSAEHKVGLPMIGAGLAGGNWAIIEVMIEETLVKAGHDVTIYKL